MGWHSVQEDDIYIDGAGLFATPGKEPKRFSALRLLISGVGSALPKPIGPIRPLNSMCYGIPGTPSIQSGARSRGPWTAPTQKTTVLGPLDKLLPRRAESGVPRFSKSRLSWKGDSLRWPPRGESLCEPRREKWTYACWRDWFISAPGSVSSPLWNSTRFPNRTSRYWCCFALARRTTKSRFSSAGFMTSCPAT